MTEPMLQPTADLQATLRASRKRRVLFAIKLLFSISILVLIFRKVVLREGADDLLTRIANASPAWIVAAIAMQLLAIACSTVRWQRLLKGQGIHPPWAFLGTSIMIARFWGAFTPGGFTGFGGWRIYDIAKHTGKPARAAATIGVEMILGQLSFFVVVMIGSFFGLRFVGLHGVLLVNAMCAGAVIAGLLLLSRAGILSLWLRRFPDKVRNRVASLVQAVGAYQGKSPLLIQAAALGVGTHAFNNLIYVCAARALGVELSLGEVFFASSLQILATLIPASINGIGLREAAAVALYTSPAIGLPMAVAVLIPTLGFACEMFVSAFGGLFFIARKPDYDPQIIVDEPEREELLRVPEPHSLRSEAKPQLGRALISAINGGALGGMIFGLIEAGAVAILARDEDTTRLFLFGIVVYTVIGAGLGLFIGGGLSFIEQLWLREIKPVVRQYARSFAIVFGGVGFALCAFGLRRDVFHEAFSWKSPQGLLLFAGTALATALVTWLAWRALCYLGERRAGAWLTQRWWGTSILIVGLVALVLLKDALTTAAPQKSIDIGSGPATGPGNILFIVIDTLRADHLPAYGYQKIQTPNLDAFVKDAIRFEHAFTNSSWTRPSFASLLSGRFASSHGAMAKNEALPESVVTLPEALKQKSYRTAGIVTNFNVAPFFHFDQGFDEYRYLEPDFVLGADDLSAKLLAVQWLKQKTEKIRALRNQVLPGAAYQDAETVNRELFAWLNKKVAAPWLLFVGYMDPHDPYLEHPYNGVGYAHAAHPNPDPKDAPGLIRLYDGEIQYWDEQFGKLIAELKKLGLYDSMTIVITADHGEEFLDHGGYFHGTTLYDEQVHVPLLLKLPNNERGGTSVSHWVQSIDIMPTLLQLAGAPIPKEVQGGSLFSSKDLIFAEQDHQGNILSSVRGQRSDGAYKLITANPGNPRRLKETELYRVSSDPHEQHDLSVEESNVVSAQKQLLSQHASGATPAASSEVELDNETTERLRALGYVE